VCGVFLLATPSPAAAHAVLTSATPASGAVLTAAPHTLTLLFDEDVVPQYARVDVTAARGGDVGGVPSVDGSVVTVPLGTSSVGSYTVRWRMVASGDGHATEGAFSFGVGVKPLPPGPAKGLEIPVAPQLLAWLQFLGVVLAGGMLTFRALVSGPASRALGQGDAPDAQFAIWVGVAGAVLALHAGVASFLVGAYPILGGGGFSNFVDAQIEPIRIGTHIGQAFTLATFAWLGVLALLIAAWVTPRRRERLLAGAGVLALAIAFGLSWASHPASRGTLSLLADYVHLLAAALWLGGLAALMLAARAARSTPSAAREAMVRTCVLRFSKLAVPAVAVVGLAGLYLALRELPSASAVLSTNYGVTLLVKSIIALGALALGGYHRSFVVPRLAAGAPVATIRRTLWLELSLLLTVILFAAILSQTAPPGQ
jgi:copper transport protein